MKPKKKTLNSYRIKSVRDFLIALNNYYVSIENGNPEGFVFVFMDESACIHQNHASKFSCCEQGKADIDRKSGKGRRLIILHAITVGGPLTEFEVDGSPVSDLKWKCDTPHPEPREDGKLTCETLWIAQSHTGDYHDNMNSEMYMKWVKEKLIPTFERRYPGKKMILVADNAPYHHSREIGSLASLSKKKILEMMEQDNVEWIELPLTDSRVEHLEDAPDDVDDRGDCIQVPFDKDEQAQTAGSNRPRVASVQELKVAHVSYLKKVKPERLECKVEKALTERGHKILWTPPHCPDLQPIEIFWALGKSHAAHACANGAKMKDCVCYLREGWWGNGLGENGVAPDHDNYKPPVDCKKLFGAAIKHASEKFIPLCPGIEGAIELATSQLMKLTKMKMLSSPLMPWCWI